MPAVGDQHRGDHPNPFVENKTHIAENVASDIATLASRLEKKLGPEYISSRPGAGGQKIHYLAAEHMVKSERVKTGQDITCNARQSRNSIYETSCPREWQRIDPDKCINLANEVFGFNGWSSSIQQIQVDFVDENQSSGRISLGLSVVIRVTLRDGSYHEDIGYGHIENCKGKAPAFEKAKKEGTTDALKRTLRNFGNLLGNCVYDKDYIAKVTKLKANPAKWDPDDLHRHHSVVPPKSFDTPALPPPHDPPRRLESLEDEFGSDDFDEVDFAVPQEDGLEGVSDQSLEEAKPPQQPSIRPPQPSVKDPSKSSDPPVTFVTGRAAESVQHQRSGTVTPFNPHLDSPSIRKTHGVDHSRTKPVSRDVLPLPPPQNPPQLKPIPRIGAPNMNSPLQNRGQYRPPTVVKRPAAAELERPPLTEASANVINSKPHSPVKRARTDDRPLATTS